MESAMTKTSLPGQTSARRGVIWRGVIWRGVIWR
jgi:hypothetical protein